jgi:hypothetical protein
MPKIFHTRLVNFKLKVSFAKLISLLFLFLLFFFADGRLRADDYLPPYGYWVTKSDLGKISPMAINALRNQGGDSSLKHGISLKPADSGSPYSKEAEAIFGHGMRRAFSSSPKPALRVYLIVLGAPAPTEAPQVYYRFTKRSRARHGGVPLVSQYHKAEVLKDETGLWAADLIGKSYGTFEIYSRYELNGTVVFSQVNFIHSMREEDKEYPNPDNVLEIPKDWPIFLFPASKYNDMPFRGTRTDTLVTFSLSREGKPLASDMAFLLETKEGPYLPKPLSFDESTFKLGLSPDDDPDLKVSSGPVTAVSDQKTMVALAKLSNGEVMTFSFSVSRSKWSYKKPAIGLALLLSVAGLTGIVTVDRRKKFKFNNFR